MKELIHAGKLHKVIHTVQSGPSLWWSPTPAALAFRLRSSYSLVCFPCSARGTLFLLFWSDGRSRAGHTNPLPVTGMHNPHVTVTDHFRTPCCYRPIIQEIRVVSQEDSKSNALLHYRQGSSSPQSTPETLTQNHFSKRLEMQLFQNYYTCMSQKDLLLVVTLSWPLEQLVKSLFCDGEGI